MAPWNDTEDRQLLLSVISVARVNPNWEEVSKQMGKTKEAVRQRFAKLKKEAGENTAAGAAAGDDDSVATPVPRKRKSKAKKDEEDDDDEDTPLTKKTKKSQKVIKAEDEDEDEA
ncbi:hypothetical protein QM012_000524 [Aureobasidium pullulans]|uniref:Myb-like domain-containing protein n=1 Tax=Aureobasidium pullulans TaxID=5580 RepID=A0ABR0TWQ4_AURPU